MTDQQDRELLLSIFLMEAWDTVATVEDGLGHVTGPAATAEDARASMAVVTHRLKGAAGLHGFSGVADVSGAMEALLERTDARSWDGEAAGFLAETVATLKHTLDVIAATGGEDQAAITDLKARYADAFAPAVPESAASATPAAPAAAPGAPSARLASPADSTLGAEMDRFFAENADILAYFGPEAAEHLEVMSKSLMTLEGAGASEHELNSLFRAVHTLKGAAYTVGCVAVGNLAHQVEDLLVAVREDRVPLSPAVIESAFAGTDALKLLLGIGDGAATDVPTVVRRAVAALGACMPAQTPLAEAAPLFPASPALVDAPAVALVPAALDGATRATPGPSPFRSTIRVNLDRLDTLMNLVGELVIARSRLDQRFFRLERLDELLAFSRTRMTQAVRDFEGKHYDPQLPGVPEDRVPGTPAAARFDDGGTHELLDQHFAELEFDRYDDFNILARSVGEISGDLSEVQSQLADVIRAIREDTSQIQRLTGSLRNQITRARMVPIGQLYARFARQVREAAKAAGKAVSLEVSGEAVEVDNSIVEQISDPLLHLVQNAIAHGIEPENARRRLGKPSHGTIYLSAYHRGGSIYIEVEDDGRGIDADLVKERAIQQGLLRSDAAPLLSREEALNLIFLPGFTTARAVTLAAGRGVGMDVVRTNVARLNGEIEVETELGVGTRFTIKLPLTVVIFDALLVRASTETLAVPLNAVRLIQHVHPHDVQRVGRRELLRVEEQLVDLVRMDQALGLVPSEVADRLPVLVLRAGGRSVAVAVDQILSKDEIVIKRLGGFPEGIGPFTGATISGEGRVILLVDPARLLEIGDSVVRGIAPEAVSAHRDMPGAAHPGEASRRVLLVDDSISVRRFVGHMLEKAGFHVTTANDGAEALERAADTAFDVVVTDLEMPRVNGFELIEDLRRRAATRTVPVVVLTTRAGEKHLSLARRLGVKHYATKPVDEQALIRLVESLAARPAPAGELAASGAAR